MILMRFQDHMNDKDESFFPESQQIIIHGMKLKWFNLHPLDPCWTAGIGTSGRYPGRTWLNYRQLRMQGIAGRVSIHSNQTSTFKVLERTSYIVRDYLHIPFSVMCNVSRRHNWPCFIHSDIWCWWEDWPLIIRNRKVIAYNLLLSL